MILQDDVLLNTSSELPFAEYGCALFDLAYLGVHWTMEEERKKGLGYTFLRNAFLEDCEAWLKSGALSPELIVHWDKIAQDMGLPYRLVFEKGTFKLPPDRKLKEGELQIVYLHNPETGFKHFVVMNKYDQIVYDSLGQSITGMAYDRGIAYIIERRVFRRIK